MTLDSLVREFISKGLCKRDIDKLLYISGQDERKFRRYAQRRLFKEPLAYISGKIDFLGREFNVDRRVYIPNRETEIMVNGVIEMMSNDSTVLDVGTGSGCIAVTIAEEFPNASVYACDIDPGVLDVARENARIHRADVELYESYYVDDLEINQPDFVISDMPYGSEEYALASINIEEFRHMPPQACFHPLGILGAYKELIESIQQKGWKTQLFFESGNVSKEDVEEIIPSGKPWKYNGSNGYSYSVVSL